MWASCLWFFTIAAVGVRASQVVVPMCCEDGQDVDMMDYNAMENNVYCNDTSISYVEGFEDIRLLERSHHPLNCPTIMSVEDPYRSWNLTFEQRLEMLVSKPYGNNICFGFTNDTVWIFTCVEPVFKEKAKVNWKFTLTSGVSVILLLITAAIYSMVNPFRKNARSPYIVAHNLSLVMAYMSRMTLQFITISEKVPECVAMAFVQQFASLSAFFWMSAICVDVYITIRNKEDDEFVNPIQDYRRMVPPKKNKSVVNKQFLLLSLYAWGIPLFFTISTIVFELSDILPDNSPWKPHIARWESSCFITDGDARWYLYKYPLAFSIVASTAVFVMTALVLYKHSRTMASIQEDSKFINDKKCYFLYVKLFVIMGIGWGFSWTLDAIIKAVLKATQSQVPPFFTYLYIVVDFIFCLQGIFIFILFVCKKKVICILAEELPFLRHIFKLPQWMTHWSNSEEFSSSHGERGMASADSRETVL